MARLLPLLPTLFAVSAASLAKPTAIQETFLDWRMTTFLHFSITTFTGSQTGNQDPSLFAPDPHKLNLTQWAEVAKNMGSPVAVLTSKHEAGYILWQTEEPIGAEFSIKRSKTVPTRDLVAEHVAACRKVGIKPGLYFTTTDAYQSAQNISAAARRAAQLQQITELTTKYGELAYLWFDHHAVQSSSDLWFAIDNIVRKNQPNAVVLGMDTSQVGGEGGFAPYPWWYPCDTVDGTEHGRCLNRTGTPGGKFWKSAESDCSIFGGCHPWFCCGTVQTLAQSMGHWEATVGRGTEFIMNVPPNKTGVIDDQLVAATAAFGAEVERRYGSHGSPLAKAGDDGTMVGAASGTVAVGGAPLVARVAASATGVNRIWLSEDNLAGLGQRVSKYHLDYRLLDDSSSSSSSSSSSWVPIPLNTSTGGLTVGRRHIDVLSSPLRSGSGAGSAMEIRFTLDKDVGEDHEEEEEEEMAAGGVQMTLRAFST